MKIIVRGRQGGKTTEMIRLAAETHAYIVCTDQRRARQIAQQARDMGLSIPFPLTASEWQKHHYHPPGVRGIMFDDLDRIIQDLSAVPALAATWTAEVQSPAGDRMSSEEEAGGRVSVHREALDALIEYANSERDRADSQFCVSIAEYEASQRELDDLVAALDLKPEP